MSKNLNVSTTIVCGQHYEINGLNVWDYKWKLTGERLSVKEPLYKRQLNIPIYQITSGEVTGIFAADEVSNCVYLIFHAS